MKCDTTTAFSHDISKNILNINYSNSDNLKTFKIAVEDKQHFLKCNTTLEVHPEDNENKYLVVLCHFPAIDEDSFNTLISFDETLYGAIMISFQLKILNELMLFCAKKYCKLLKLVVNDEMVDELEIYKNFVTDVQQISTVHGPKKLMHIPTDYRIYDELVDLMESTQAEFEKSLWSGQQLNPVIRRYLKVHRSV